MNWADVLQDKSLRDLPYKIETNEYGQIVMSPASNRHSILQGRMIRKLSTYIRDGEIMPECSVQTPEGVKVADVAWASLQFLSSHNEQLAYEAAPELCVEVLSPLNLVTEIENKTALYFQQGAVEVWICSDTGAIRFIGRQGDLERSVLFPVFPAQI